MLFNIAADFLVAFFKDQTMFAIEHSDYVFCNEVEGSALAKAYGLEESDRVGAAKCMAKSKKANMKRPRVAIITQGADDVIIAEHNPETPDVEPVVTMVPIE